MEQLVAGDALVSGEELSNQDDLADLANGRRLRPEVIGVFVRQDEDSEVVLSVSAFRPSRRSINEPLEVCSNLFSVFIGFGLNVEAVGR